MHPKLQWTYELATSLGDAMGCGVVVGFHDDVDPLKKHVVLTFGEELGKGNYNPIQQMVHAFAKSNDCVVYRIRRPQKNVLSLEVLTKTRLSPVMNKNPLKSRDKGGTDPA